MDKAQDKAPQNPEIEPYFQGVREGRLMIRRCEACKKPHFYPRAICPFCFGETQWETASGSGTIYSYSVMRRADPVYVVAYVRLEEGVTMLTNIVTGDPDALRIDMPVKARFGLAGVPEDAVVFEPVSAA
jgi:uncharacterized OB-fold protein